MPDRRLFHLATHQEIKAGEVADVYFNRTVQILRARGNRARVKAEVYLKNLPGDWGWGILAGIEEVSRVLARHFPPRPGDRNELPDRPTIL